MQEQYYKRNCPDCGKEILYTSLASFRRVNPNSKYRYCCNVIRGNPSNRKGCKHSGESKSLISKSQTGRKLSLHTRFLMSSFQKFYVDGYDPIHNIVLEYDGKYHTSVGQQKRDLIRQQKIIDILHPKKFWRYDSKNKSFQNVLGGISL